MGPTDSKEAKKNFPRSLRAQFGTDTLRNSIHASSSASDYQREK
ncbi:MAG: nucleoside-diphosphate kinase [bacterium]